MVTVGRQTWVGQALPRLEDEALLRGLGSFIDDLDPVANAAQQFEIAQAPLVGGRQLSVAAFVPLSGCLLSTSRVPFAVGSSS